MKIYTHILFVLLCLQQATAQIFINEVQTSNDVTTVDNFLEADDWIELYNPTGTSIDLAGYFISDDGGDLLQHQIKTGNPELTTVPANGYLLLWADKDEEQGVNHLNFKLKAGGETIYITSSNGLSLIDSLQVPALEDDESYIRKPDGTGNIYVNPTPTPEASNNNVTLNLTDPVISLPGGKYNSTQTISINADAGADIYYTTDGSIPTTSSTIYNGAFNLNTSAAVKAIAVKPGFRDSKMVYESYILGATSDLSIVNISIDPGYLFDDQVGFYTEGTNGLIGPCMDEPKNWWQDWEYEATVTLYEENGDIGFNEACGIQISGGCSRNKDKKSFNVKFKSEYGEKNLNYKLFNDTDVDFFDGFKLRNGGSPGTMRIQDVVAQKTMENQFDIDMQHSRPVALYINGEYWGLYHIRDRINTGYLQSYHTKVDHDNVDYIKFPGSNGSWRWWATQEVKSGDDVAYNEMHNYAVNNDLSIDVNYQTLTEQIDVNELTNYLISHIYLNNGDWPENNIKIWKERAKNSKWRWAFFDVDFINWYKGGYTNVGLFDEFMNETDATERRNPKSTELYRNLFDNASFKNEFVQKMNTYIHTVWDYNRTNPLFLDAKNKVASEIDADFNRWGGWDFNKWNTEVNKLDEYFMNRPAYARTMVKNVLGLGETMDLTLNFDANTPGSILLHQNFFEVPSNYQATYFKDMEMYLHAVPKPGYRFVQWNEISDTQFKYSQNIYKPFGKNKTLTPVFEPAEDLLINEIFYNPEGKEEDNEFIEIYNPGDKARSLWGYQFTNGIKFQFPKDAVIQADEYIVVAHNDSAYVNNNYQVFQWESGSLNNDGEAIVFSNPTKEVIDSVYYNDNDLWNQSADGLGFSLALLDEVTDNNLPTSWNEQVAGSEVTPGSKNDFCGQITNNATVANISCFGANDGFIASSISGGTPPYQYSWSNGSTTNTISNLTAGQYTLSITNSNNCTLSEVFTISEPASLTATTYVTNETGQQANNGTAMVTISGGVAPYSYNWSNNATTASINNLSPGVYTVNILDTNGCSITKTITINTFDCNDLLGTSCDDGNPDTIDDIYDDSCNCAGIFISCNILINTENFESGWGIWNDGGSDARRQYNSTYASSGNYSAAIQDNTSTSVITTDNLDLETYSEVEVSFNYFAVSMDNSNEDFWLQISTDGGSSFTTLQTWARSINFNNNTAYTETVNIQGPFTAGTKLRFRCDASANADDVYLDDIEIIACIGGNNNCPTEAQSCDDGDPCTTGETYDANCNCAGGTFQDADGDGVCNANDICATGNDNIDSDNDGTPDACDTCPNDTNDACGLPTYCASNSTNSNYEFIDNVTFGQINNSSGNNGGYADFSNITSDAAPGSSVSVSLTAGYPGTTYPENWKVWIDLNRDGDFDDSGEEVFSGSGTGTVTGNINIPANANLGATGMRVTMQWNANSTPCSSFNYGEVEDYTINLTTTPLNRVNASASTVNEEVSALFQNIVSIFPNPASHFVSVDLDERLYKENSTNTANLKIYTLEGKLVLAQSKPVSKLIQLNIETLPANQHYFIEMNINNQIQHSAKFLKF